MIPVRMTENSLTVPVKVTPQGGRNEVQPLRQGEEWVRVKVSAAPEGGKANKAVESLLAEQLGLPTSAVSVVAGDTAKMKRVAFTTNNPQDTLVRLAELVGQPPEGCFRPEEII